MRGAYKPKSPSTLSASPKTAADIGRVFATPPAAACAQLSNADISDYCADMATQLSAVAQSTGNIFLAYLFNLASQEAASSARRMAWGGTH